MQSCLPFNIKKNNIIVAIHVKLRYAVRSRSVYLTLRLAIAYQYIHINAVALLSKRRQLVMSFMVVSAIMNL